MIRSNCLFALSLAAALATASGGGLPVQAQSPPQAGARAEDAEVAARREELRRKLISFVIVEYLGTGVADHENAPTLYDDSVAYYGRTQTRDAVMSAKRAYYRKWPSRRYDFVESSLVPKPGGRDGSVEFSFRYTFEVTNSQRVASGTGIATLEVRLLDDDRIVIVRENGQVLKQTSRPL